MSVSTTSIYMSFDTCRVLGFAAIAAGYTAIGTPSDKEGRSLIIQNLTDATLWFSDDGVNNKFPLVAGASSVIDLSANQSYTRGFFWPIGATLYVKQLGVPTTGNVYFTIIYGN